LRQTRAISRRELIGNGAVLALALTSPSLLGRSLVTRAGADLTRSTFAPLVGDSFRMRGAGIDHAVVLSRIDDLVPVLRPHDERRFALNFDVPFDQPRVGAIRSLWHRRTGAIDLFVAPVGPGWQASTFEAVINRL